VFQHALRGARDLVDDIGRDREKAVAIGIHDVSCLYRQAGDGHRLIEIHNVDERV